MANRVFLIPRRNDLAGLGLVIQDLTPGFQPLPPYDGQVQSCYLGSCLDTPAATVSNADAYVSGSKNTTLVAGDSPAADATIVANNVLATQTCTFGLAAYLQERVHAGGIGAVGAPCFTFAQANAAALAIMNAANTGAALTLAAINVLLSVVVAQTDLDGATAPSKSFGTVLDVLRILSGEVYRRQRFVITSLLAGAFQSLAERDVLVAAQVISTNGGTTFTSHGVWLTATEHGYVGRPTLARTGAFNGSNGGGDILVLKGNRTILNPAFAYTAAAVSAWLPRAMAADGVTVIPATGIYPCLQAYTHLGVVL